MSGKYFKTKKIVIPTLTVLLIASMLQGCSATTQTESTQILNNSTSIELTVNDPDFAQSTQGTQESLTWTVLGNLTDVPELRAAWDEILGTTGSAGSKEGPLYVNTEGNPDQNVTLQMALHNKAFLDAYVNDIEKLSAAAGKSYADVDDEEMLQQFAIAANGYFNILPDSQNGYANPNGTLTRAQAMSAVMRATTPVSDNITENEDFSGIVGKSEYNKYAQDLDNECFISTKDKSLNQKNYNGKMTKAEAVYMLVNKFFSDDLDAMTLDNEDVEFDDCINGGNIIAQQTKGESVDASALKSMLDNPDKGVDESIYRAMVVGYNNEIIGDTTDWDTSVTKADFMDMLINSIKSSTSMNVFNEMYNAVNGGGTDIPAHQEDVERYEEMENSEEQSTEDSDTSKLKGSSDKKDKKDKKDKDYTLEDIKDTTMYAKSSCNIRKGPGTNYDKNGSLAYAQKVTVTHKAKDKDGKTWYRIGKDKFVAASLLTDTKPSTVTSSNSNKNNSSSSSSKNSSSSSSSKNNSSSSSSSKKNNSSSSSSSKNNSSSSSSKKNNSSKNNSGKKSNKDNPLGLPTYDEPKGPVEAEGIVDSVWKVE